MVVNGILFGDMHPLRALTFMVYCVVYKFLKLSPFYYILVRICLVFLSVFAHGVMGCRIDPSWPWYVLSCLWDQHIKEPLLLIGKSSPCGGSSFFSRYLSGPLSYV